ncbi:MAG: M28 family peptidase, partial [Ferruginibacter sp.]
MFLLKSGFLLFLSALSFSSHAQDINKIITSKEVHRIESVLASDSLKGRKVFSKEIDQAAEFIASEFKSSKLDFFPGLTSYQQPFLIYQARFLNATGTINNNSIVSDNIIAITTKDTLNVNEASNYTRLRIDSSLDLAKEASRLLKERKNYVIFVDSFHVKNFSRLKRFKRDGFMMNNNVVFVLTNENPLSYSFNIHHSIKTQQAQNVVAMIAGKTKPDEFVVFSGHYDHLGTTKPNATGDSIYNGANDDAAGTTAVIALANYFNKIKNNDRTLIFV